MKKSRYLLVFVLINVYILVEAQLYDKVWLNGIGFYSNASTNYVIRDTNTNIRTTLHLDGEPLEMERDSLGRVSLDLNNITISNKTGDSVLFYSNGIVIRNRYNQVMQNGDSLAWTNWLSHQAWGVGSIIPHTHICVPTDSFHIFYYFYTDFDYYGETVRPLRLLAARIDVLNNKLTFKDSVILNGVLNQQISATKDADGGWWIVVTEVINGCINLVHLDRNANITKRKICDNNFIPFYDGDIVPSVFTQDGTKLVLIGHGNNSLSSGIEVFNFDRCSGELILEKKNHLFTMLDSNWVSWTAAGSPNSRYIYAFTRVNVLQFDIEAEDLAASMQIVAVRDTIFYSDFYQGMLALDGKIYINNFNGEPEYCVIANPDLAGLACNVIQNVITTDSLYDMAFPYYPNYRLGNVDCASGIEDIKQINRVVIYPNPAESAVFVSLTGNISGDVQVQWHDALGRVAQINTLQNVGNQASYTLNTTNLTAGVYQFIAKQNGNTVFTQKVVIVK